MDSPKLKINNKLIGLRVGDEPDIFEPKSVSVLANVVSNISTVNQPVTIAICFQNCSSDVLKKLAEIERQMLSEKWNLVVIDNGSSDDTYAAICNHKSSANYFIHATVEKTIKKDEIDKICMSYAKPLTFDSYVKVIIDDSVILEHNKIKSFCCVGTSEVKKELALSIFSIRCYHNEPIYIVCDTETKNYISHKFDCVNIFFDISADKKHLDHINRKYAEQFSSLNNGLHRLDCIFLKMRAIEIALLNEDNTLFVDSDIIFCKQMNTPIYADVVLSPHYWSSGRGAEFGIYNAGYVSCADKTLPDKWRKLFLTDSNYCEQECMSRFPSQFDVDIFDKRHNVGFWRSNIPGINNIYSFHSHLFGQPGNRKDVTLKRQRLFAARVIRAFKNSSDPVHKNIYQAIVQLKFDKDNSISFPDMNGKYLSTSWAHYMLGTPVTSNTNSKLKLLNQTVFQSHRSGWSYAIDALIPLHNDQGTLFDGFLENQFGWTCPTKRYAYDEPWVGVFHNPQNIPDWFFSEYSIDNLIKSDHFQRSLETCKGLYALSEYHGEYIRSITGVPVDVLAHPTEIPDKLFSFELFVNNENKKIINIGYWLRKLTSIYQLPVNSYYTKCRLLPYSAKGPKKIINELMTTEIEKNGIKWNEYFENTTTLDRVSNVEYDNLLAENIVFLDLYDSSANNAVIECIARGTPLLINPIPAVVEYLGTNYPFYFNTLEEAADKVRDHDLIQQTNNYLLNCETRQKFSPKYFRDSIINSSIYQSL